MSGIILRPGPPVSNEDEYEEDPYLPPERPLPSRSRIRSREAEPEDETIPEDFADDIQLQPASENGEISSMGEDAEEGGKTGEETEGEKDKGFLYFSMVVAGLGVLLPFNAFTIATDYYVERFKDYPDIVFNINLCYLVCNFVGVLFGNLFVETIAFPARTMGGFAVSLTSLLFVTIFDMLLELFDEDTGYKLTLSAVAISAFGTSVAQSSLYGYTSMLPMRYSQGVMVGESMAGTVVSLARVITKAVVFTNLALSAAIFFGVCMGTLLLAMLLFHVSRQTPLALSYINSCHAAIAAEHARSTKGEKTQILQRGGSQKSQASQKDYGTSGDKDKGTETVITTTALDVSAAIRSRGKAIRDLWSYVLGIALTYCVTASIYPAILSEVTSTVFRSWMSIFLYSLYNFFDLMGKILSSLSTSFNGIQLMLWALSRFILVVLILLCILPLNHPIFDHEAYSAVLSVILGVTNGYLGSVFMMEAGRVVEEERKEMAGNIMTLALCFGLTVGAGLSYLWDWVINLTGNVST